jgi:hypothetical protein
MHAHTFYSTSSSDITISGTVSRCQVLHNFFGVDLGCRNSSRNRKAFEYHKHMFLYSLHYRLHPVTHTTTPHNLPYNPSSPSSPSSRQTPLFPTSHLITRPIVSRPRSSHVRQPIRPIPDTWQTSTLRRLVRRRTHIPWLESMTLFSGWTSVRVSTVAGAVVARVV